jgi:hypothetical protein
MAVSRTHGKTRYYDLVYGKINLIFNTVLVGGCLASDSLKPGLGGCYLSVVEIRY